jgi:D-alanyl-D-alanine carboxypeptidase/D-alanyl-D-alanine-endopeptidase (penicillin-binding protein 4)
MRSVLRRHVLTTGVIACAIAGAAGLGVGIAPPAAAAVRTPRRAQSLATLARAVHSAFSGSTATDVHYRIDIAGSQPIRHDSTLTSHPASNEKLLTTQTLLAEVGPTFHYHTRIYATAPLDSAGVEHGDLVVLAGGDPALTSSTLSSLATRLHQAGLRHVTGHLVIDDSRYNHQTRAPGWKHDFVPGQTGPIDAFSVNSNTGGHSAAYLRDPTLANAQIFRTALHHAHITVHGTDTTGLLPVGATLIGSHASAPLQVIVEKTLDVSDNFSAEMMLREAGYQRSGIGTRSTGVAAVLAEAHRLGVTLGHVADGSGLSYADEESPRAMIGWLHAVRSQPTFPVVYDGVPTSCRSGTLRYRLCGSHVAGRVHAKTGTLDHVVALSGWTHTRDGRLVTFSFLLSHVRSLYAAQQHLDAAVSRLARYG